MRKLIIAVIALTMIATATAMSLIVNGNGAIGGSGGAGCSTDMKIWFVYWKLLTNQSLCLP